MNSLNVDDNFCVYASMSGDWTLLQKLSHTSNNFNLRPCYKSPPFSSIHLSFSFCVQNILSVCCIIQQLFNNLITASFVPYSSNLVGKYKPRPWHPRAGGPQGKRSSILYSSRTYTVFQNIYSTSSKNSPMSNTQSSFIGKNKRKPYNCIYSHSFYLPHTVYQHTSRKCIQVLVWLSVLFS